MFRHADWQRICVGPRGPDVAIYLVYVCMYVCMYVYKVDTDTFSWRGIWENIGLCSAVAIN
jgi:hypothetical protein